MDNKYKELTNIAFNLHQKGSFDEAKNIYLKLLEINPNDCNILNLLGMLFISQSQYNDAIKTLNIAVDLTKNSYIISNLAKAYFLNDEIENSIKFYNLALEINKTDDIYYSLALAYKKINLFEDAVNSYTEALNLNPNNYSALYNLSILLKDEGRYCEALEYSLRAYKISNSDVQLLSLISYLYEVEGNIEQAIYYLHCAIKIDSTQANFYFNLGVLYSKLNNNIKSIESYLIALKIDVNHVESYINLANIYKDKDVDIAIEYLNKAFEISPNNEKITLLLAKIYKDNNDNKSSISVLEKYLKFSDSNSEIYISLAINYMDLGQYATALHYYEKALYISPSNLNYLHGKATSLKYLDKINEAKEILEKIVLSPNATYQSKITLGMLYLAEKRFDEGMNLYSLRSYDTKLNSVFKNCDLIWKKGDDLSNKDVLVYSDCGLGDTIMFARYLPFLKDKCKSLTLQTDKELVRILKSNYPEVNVIRKAQQHPKYDIVLPLMNISWALNSDFYSIPYANGYLDVDEKGIHKFKELFDNEKINVGVFSKGNTRVFKNRAIPKDIIQKIFDIENISFYSMEKDSATYSVENITDLSSYIDDYYDTACILKSLDCLITIDSSIAHMAGALGVKTFLLLPHTPEWRWFKDDKETPWYNSVRIFKQKEPTEWSEVIARVKYELINNTKK